MLIINQKPNLIQTNGKIIMPGTNVVDPVWWEKTRKHPSIKQLLESGKLTEEIPLEEAKAAEALGDEGANDAIAEHITTLSVNHARQLIADTVDVKLLKIWLKRDERKTIKDLIKKQIGKIEEPAEIRDRSKQRQIVTGRAPETVHLEAKPGAQDD